MDEPPRPVVRVVGEPLPAARPDLPRPPAAPRRVASEGARWRRTRAGVALLLVFVAGVTAEQLREDRARERRDGGTVALGVALLDRQSTIAGGLVTLRLRVDNRGPRAVRLVRVTVPGTLVDQAVDGPRIAAGATSELDVTGRYSCGAPVPVLPGRLEVRTTVRTDRGERTATVRAVADAPVPRPSGDCGTLPIAGDIAVAAQDVRPEVGRLRAVVSIVNRSGTPLRLAGVRVGDAAAFGVVQAGRPVHLPAPLTPAGPASFTPGSTYALLLPYPADCAALLGRGALVQPVLVVDSGSGTRRSRVDLFLSLAPAEATVAVERCRAAR